MPLRESFPWVEPLVVKLRLVDRRTGTETLKPSRHTADAHLIIEGSHEAFALPKIERAHKTLRDFLSAELRKKEGQFNRDQRMKHEDRIRILTRQLRTVGNHRRAIRKLTDVAVLQKHLNDHALRRQLDLEQLEAEYKASQRTKSNKREPVTGVEPWSEFSYPRRFGNPEERGHLDAFLTSIGRKSLRQLMREVKLFNALVSFQQESKQMDTDQFRLVHTVPFIRRKTDPGRVQQLKRHFASHLRQLGFFVREE